ncbi:Glucose import ATP-binding protein GlcV [Candidatus Lokiarchaeum ossiferum]|uniref:Glucose import ATP-binding protein GlcV n=1 Tax=Candidatus Lokiarchaeum ossiferum TaxID=2951803 RepID=A0ABY6HQX3_9ARCH|nr:Glucose import ATP-binding protein GlcV [Candidatus Lokiarchaeum sp. B-35]
MSANLAKEPCIKFHSVAKTYNGGTIKALSGVNLSVKKGEIFGYIGPNGAGKTTSIKILVGLIHDFAGSVSINGHDLIKNRLEVHKLIGYLPQSVGFQEWRTVNHALRTFGLLSGVDSSILDNKIDEVLSLVGLPDVKDRKIVHLSGGMKQKLLLAQALLHDPEVLVLDEPMTGLDPSSRYQMRKIIQKLAEKDITIFFSSHILSDVQGIATQIGILNNGQILKVGTPQELQDQFKVGNDIEIVYKSAISNCTGIEKISGVQSVENVSSNKILVHLPASSDLDQITNEILTLIAEQKCNVLNFNVLKASLEDVYLKYVEGQY